MKTTRWLAAGALLLVPLVAFAGVRGMHGGRCGGNERPESAEEVREHMATKAEFALDRVDATDEQRAKIDGILDQAAQAAFDHHEEADALRAEAHELLVADTIDRDALEQIRLDAVALFDDGSKQLVRVVGDIAETLTPEQRQQLAQDIARFHGR